VLHLQRRYNREFPAIFNTYQCYLRDTYQRVCVDLERSRREGFLFAAKTVRGIYFTH
jgi:proline dehydrogenase